MSAVARRTLRSLFLALPRVAAASTLALLAGACTEEKEAMIVTVEVRPSVIGAEELTVQLRNGTSIVGNTFELRDQAFPLTFSISSPERTGELEIEVSATRASNGSDILVGRGTTLVPITAATGKVLVDSADFVVNSDYPDDQFLTDDFESTGTQLSSNPSGEWIASYRQRCNASACNVFARRFGRDGQAISSGDSGGNAFAVNSSLKVVSASTPTVMAGVDKSLVVWETAATTTADGVACRAFDRAGLGSTEKRLSTDNFPDVVVGSALPNGTFAIGWSSRVGTETTNNLRTLVVDGNCDPLPGATVQPVATLVPESLRRSSIAGAGAAYMMAWHSEDTIRARAIALNGVPASADTLLLSPSVGERYGLVKLAANNNGYVMVVSRYINATRTVLEMYRVTASATAAPQLVGSALTVTDQLDDELEGFAVASHPLGPILVTWHGCGERGDGENCGVFGRYIATNGTPYGDSFLIPTTTALDQKNSSITPLVGENGEALFVVAWNDSSTAPPDMGGQSVRARILYPELQP